MLLDTTVLDVPMLRALATCLPPETAGRLKCTNSRMYHMVRVPEVVREVVIWKNSSKITDDTIILNEQEALARPHMNFWASHKLALHDIEMGTLQALMDKGLTWGGVSLNLHDARLTKEEFEALFSAPAREDAEFYCNGVTVNPSVSFSDCVQLMGDRKSVAIGIRNLQYSRDPAMDLDAWGRQKPLTELRLYNLPHTTNLAKMCEFFLRLGTFPYRMTLDFGNVTESHDDFVERVRTLVKRTSCRPPLNLDLVPTWQEVQPDGHVLMHKNFFVLTFP